MDTYKVQKTVKNGQLIIDLPSEFDNTLVEITVSQVSAYKGYADKIENISIAKEPSTAYVDNTSKEKTAAIPNELEASEFIPPQQKVDFKKLKETLNLNMTINEADAFARSLRGDSPFVPPRKKIKLSTLMGAYKNKMTNDEIDSLTKSWRDEWNRDFS